MGHWIMLSDEDRNDPTNRERSRSACGVFFLLCKFPLVGARKSLLQSAAAWLKLDITD